MLDFYSAVAIVLATCLIALTGFGGKHVAEEPKDQPVVRRITWRGYAFLLASVLVVSLKIWEEWRRAETLSGRLPPDFYQLTEEVTGFGKDDWNRYIAMRLHLRYLLGKIYKQHFSATPAGPPESIAKMTADLTEGGVIPEALCRNLDFLREKTYSFEWGRGRHPTGPELAQLRSTANTAFAELSAVQTAPKSARNESSLCVKELRDPGRLT